MLKHPILSGIGILMIHSLASGLLMLPGNELIHDALLNAAIEFAAFAGIAFLLVLLVKKVLKNRFESGLTGKNLLECLKFGWLFPAFLIVEVLIGGSPLSALSHVTFTSAIIALLLGAAAGFGEELTFRSILANNMMTAWINKKNGIYTAMFVSSVIFGLAHAGNALITGSVAGVAWQVGYAFALGALFCAMFFRTKNIWGCIIMHTFVDFVSFLFAGGSTTAENLQATLTSETSLTSLIFKVVLIVSAVALSLYLTRPAKHNEIKANFAGPEVETEEKVSRKIAAQAA